jgi:hypothetical protein
MAHSFLAALPSWHTDNYFEKHRILSGIETVHRNRKGLLTEESFPVFHTVYGFGSLTVLADVRFYTI